MRLKAMVVASSLALSSAAAGARAGEPEDQIKKTLEAYDAALSAKDLERLAAFYHPDVTIFEGGGVNDGWADYRDHHLGPELQEMGSLRFSHGKVVAHVLGDGRAAYVTSEYRLQTRIGERDIDAEGLETLVMVKTDGGTWRIRHSHTSGRRRPSPAASGTPKP